LNELDWTFDAIRRKTAQGPYEAVNYHRFADDIVITVSGHHSKRGWAERALLRLQEQLAPLGVEMNKEKTKVVDTLRGDAFGFLGFDLRRVRKSNGNGYFLRMTPKKKAHKAIKATTRHHPAWRGDPDTEAGGADQRYACWMGQLLPGWQRQSCLQRSTRICGDDGSDTPDSKKATH
jgi:hypothetical protein